MSAMPNHFSLSRASISTKNITRTTMPVEGISCSKSIGAFDDKSQWVALHTVENVARVEKG